jgi:hypothetical protein
MKLSDLKPRVVRLLGEAPLTPEEVREERLRRYREHWQSIGSKRRKQRQEQRQ